jgi:hypothetical protein
MTLKLDPILSELRAVREQYAAKFDGDVGAMMEDLRRRHAESGRTSVSRRAKPSPKQNLACPGD